MGFHEQNNDLEIFSGYVSQDTLKERTCVFQKTLTDYRHQGIKVANVKALSGDVNEVLDHSCTVLLLYRL